MATNRLSRLVTGAIFAAGLATFNVTAFGQTPWILFEDDASFSACDVVNANNVDLVVLAETREMVIISGRDVILEELQVDASLNVYYAGEPAGFLTFDFDGDDLRSLWWVSLTGRVVDVDPFDGEPGETDLFPSDFRGAACDACDYWDDQTVCLAPEPPPTIDITFCAPGMLLPMMVVALSLGAVRMRNRFGSSRTTWT